MTPAQQWIGDSLSARSAKCDGLVDKCGSREKLGDTSRPALFSWRPQTFPKPLFFSVIVCPWIDHRRGHADILDRRAEPFLAVRFDLPDKGDNRFRRRFVEDRWYQQVRSGGQCLYCSRREPRWTVDDDEAKRITNSIAG
jgi:hypothetical protein